MHPFFVMAGSTGLLLQFPGEGGGAEDGGVGFLELGEDELHLATPERDDILVHGLADGFLQELAGAGETAEEDDGLRGQNSMKSANFSPRMRPV